MTIHVTKDIADLLVTASVGALGGTSPWAIFIGQEPDSPNDCITLYDTGGDAPNPKYSLDFPRFQVRVRSHSYEQGYAKAEEIKAVLLGLPSQDIGDIRYVGIWGVVDIHFLKADTKGRKIFVSTWRVIREPSADGNRIPL